MSREDIQQMNLQLNNLSKIQIKENACDTMDTGSKTELEQRSGHGTHCSNIL